MNNFDPCADGQELIDDRINELIKTDYKPANLVNEAVAEFTVKENQQVADYVNENDMTGLGNYIYLKTTTLLMNQLQNRQNMNLTMEN